MQMWRFRLTLRGMMIAVALVGLNVAGGLATWRSIPERKFLPVTIGRGRGGHVDEWRGDGSHIRYEGGLEFDPRPLSSRPCVVIKPPDPPPPTPPSAWFPILASATTTLLVLAIAAWRSKTLRRRS